METTSRRRVWPSPLHAAAVVEGSAKPGEVRFDGTSILWSESRPNEGGRTQLVRRDPDGSIHDVLADGSSARTRVHEYGGGAWAVAKGCVVYVDDARDGQMFRLDATSGAPCPLTPPSESDSMPYAVRFADLHIDLVGDRVFAVRERHLSNGDVRNDLVQIPLDGSAVASHEAVQCVASGADFYAFPSADTTGTQLAFIRWMLPDMPWDATELVVLDLTSSTETVVAGGAGESVVEPQWAPDGTLAFSSDVTGWWNPYRWDCTQPTQAAVPLATVDAEIGHPVWVFGNRSVAWLSIGQFVCSMTSNGIDQVGLARADGTPPVDLGLSFTHIRQVVSGPDDAVVVVAGSPEAESDVWLINLQDTQPHEAEVTALRAPRDLGLGNEWFAQPASIEVPLTGGAVTYAVVYPPTNPEVSQDDRAGLPPLIVLSHGGPTSAARVQLDLTIAYWTSRGFCVADVNYRGSVGYGRPFREALNGQWGIADVEDCAAVAQHLAETGVVDPNRLGIRGGSAGGFTTLAALCFTETFHAGLSAYGIADLATLATDTHKFESRYLDRLIGPWPDETGVYAQRSPIHHLDQLSCPICILQGAQDVVVPPSQADAIIAALQSNGLPYAALTFADEGHGFRKAENIIRALEAELWFFAHAFGMELNEPIQPVPGQGLAD